MLKTCQTARPEKVAKYPMSWNGRRRRSSFKLNASVCANVPVVLQLATGAAIVEENPLQMSGKSVDVSLRFSWLNVGPRGGDLGAELWGPGSERSV